MASRTKQNAVETMKIRIGNLDCQKEAKISIQLIKSLPVESGSYCFTLPADFCPNYKKIGFQNNQDYSFKMELAIQSTKKLTQISVPEGTKIKLNDIKTRALITYEGRINGFTACYRTSEMQYPRLVYAENPKFPDEIVVHASLVPTFEPLDP